LKVTFSTIWFTIAFCFIPTAIANKLIEGGGLSWQKIKPHLIRTKDKIFQQGYKKPYVNVDV
jgi:hypothetical protein